MLAEDRFPCADGNCVGTIENGACRVCGLAGEGQAIQGGENVVALAEVVPDVPAAPAGGASSDDWDERQLCADGNCTGTVEDGACRVCGAAA